MAFSDEQSSNTSPSGSASGSVHPGHPTASHAPESDRERKTTRFLILPTLIFVTGFLGLPVLWLSKSFSLTEKLVW
ncbi:MAG: hypothetical protein MUC83_14985, partial [Pirellula sp.]|nr:hypothetical protein [Pirellula sp.]